MSAGAQSSWKPPDADRQPSGWSPPESDRTPPPAELSPLAKTGKAYSEGLGIPQLLDILRMSNRYGTPQEVAARGERGMTALKGIVQGIAGEPARVWDELSRTGESMLKGDISGTAYHLAGAVPVLGAQSQQAAMDLQRGDPAAFVGHVGAMVTPFVAGPAAGAIEALPEAAQRARVAATGAVQGGWQGATGPTVLPIKIKGVQLAEIPNVPASLSGLITGGGVGGLLGGGKGSVIGAVTGATIPIVRGAVKRARSALADLDAIAARAAQEEALANRVPLWEQQGTAATPREVPQFTSQQPPMGMDVEGNLRPGPLPSGRRVPGEAAEARGPSLTPDDVLLLRYLGETDPLSASAENIGIARDLAKQNPELVNRLRAGEPEPIVPPPTAAEAAAPTTQAVGTLEYNAPGITPAQERIVKGAQQAGEFTPEEQARAAAILENVEPAAQPATAPAATSKPAAAELAQQFEATTRPDRMLDFLKRIDPEISAAAIDNLDPNQWELVARGAGSPAGTIPTPEDIAAVRGNLAQSEGASQITAKTPEAAKAQFEQNREIRKGPAKATEPAPTTDLETQLADSLAGKRTATPPEVPAKPTASETRVETIAKHLAGLEGLNPQYLTTLTEDPQGLEALAQLGRDLKVREPQSPGEVQQIVDRVRQLRGEGAAAAPEAEFDRWHREMMGGQPEAKVESFEPASVLIPRKPKATSIQPAPTREPVVASKPIAEPQTSAPKVIKAETFQENMQRMARRDSESANATFQSKLSFPVHLREAQFTKLRGEFWSRIGEGVPFEDAFAKLDQDWRSFAEKANARGAESYAEPMKAVHERLHLKTMIDRATANEAPQTLRTLMEGEKPAAAPRKRRSK